MTTGSIGRGTVLADRYRLEDLLAENEGARFWRATDTVLARSVSVQAVASDDPRSAGLLEAARISATVTDPHLLRVLDCDDSDGITWVVNEWGDGVSLDLMLQEGTLPPSRAAWLTREVADTISVGHALGVAHGRLNPESVLVTHAGAVKLIGYVIDASLETGRAPDPMYGDLDDRETDVINLAGILYAALTGRWPGVAPSAVPRAPREGRRPLRPRQVRAGVPRTLDTICERVLNQEGSQHAMPIETAHEIAAALADYVGDPGQSAPLDAAAMHAEPTVSIPRGDLAPPPADEPVPEREQERDEEPDASVDTGDLDATQLSAAVTAPAVEAPVVAAPPPFDDLPERPLFADTARRVPTSGTPAARDQTPAQGPNPAAAPGSVEDTGTQPGTNEAGEFWPFVNSDDDRFDVHTGREGRGWLRIGVIVALLLAVVVAMAFAFNRGREDGTGTTATDDTPGSTAAPAGAKLAVADVKDFDPLGDGAENPDEVGRVVDDDPASGWQTSTYYNNAALGGLKPGVGVMLDLGRVRAPGSVAIRFKGQPTDVEVYAASAGVTQAPESLDQMTKVGAKAGAPENTTIRLDDVRTRYLLVWLTKLPPVPGGFRGEITNINVRS